MSLRAIARSTFRFAAALAPPSTPSRRLPLRGFLEPRHLGSAGIHFARLGFEMAESIRRGPQARIAFDELDDKVQAFQLFENVVSTLEIPDGWVGLRPSIEKATQTHGAEDAVWALEGIGYELAERARKRGRSPVGLLTTADAGVPLGSWTVLHTGAGMSLAEAAFDDLGFRAPAGAIGDAAESHLGICLSAARDGYAALTFEPFGLVCRLLHSKRVLDVDERLALVGGPWREYFWHGVGRGLYFAPANLSPTRSAPWGGIEMALHEAPDEIARANVLAGYAWAVCLVNMRRPAILENFLDHHGRVEDLEQPILDGVKSSLLLWRTASGGSKRMRRMLRHVCEPSRRELWQDMVCKPYENAAADTPPDLAELFRFKI